MSELDVIEDALVRVGLKDRSAFDLLYDRTSAKLFGVCLRVLQDRAQAEDALQDAYIRIWNKANMYQVNGLSPMTWLITVARNVAIDRKRKHVSKDADELPADLRDPSPSVESRLVARDDQARIAACLDELDQQKADAVKRAYLLGESYAELSERYDIPLNTIRTWLRRSLIALKECLSR
ncbi:MAG: sigma-70 family RNA polymerase sigma factor [Pseudomonadota bacterium]